MKLVLKKTASLIITLFIVSLLAFLAFQIIPGDPTTKILGTNASAQKAEALREQLGLNRPITERYLDWLVSFLQGDFGTSYSYLRPVSSLLADKLPVTALLTLLSFALTALLSIPLGIASGSMRSQAADHLAVITDQIIMAIPPFFSGILITFIFGMILKIFTPGGFVSYKDNFFGFIKYLIFPSFAIAFPKIAMTVKMLRGNLIDEAGKDYARTAYSRGNNTNGVLYRHVLKNAMIPVITFLGMALADMVAGSIVVEQVFSIPGISRILLTSISNRDYPVVEAIIMGIAIIVIVLNLLVDIIYRIIDPRIRMDD